MKDLKQILKNSNIKDLPHKPGVYFYYDTEGELIYIGKAKDLSKRIRSYFRAEKDSPKTVILVKNIFKLKYQICDSEIEALIREAIEIKKHLPKYNIKLKDDKSYSYLAIIKEIKGKTTDFPIIQITRDPKIGNNLYFGPFTNSGSLKELLKFIRRIIPFCLTKKYSKKPCLGYHLKLCPGICAKIVTEKEYQKNLKALIWFFDGKIKKVENWLDKEMKRASKSKNYELAAQYRDRLNLIRGLAKVSLRSLDEAVEDPEAVKELYKIINNKSDNLRVEGYDISNISGNWATGSMVVFNNSIPEKKSYRKFKIRLKGINDYQMMSEMLHRRFKHNEWPEPGLIMLDGGKGHLNIGLKVLNKLNKNIPIVALAKRYEAIYTPKNINPIFLPKNSIARLFLQRVRDESHRFAKSYHANLRKKSLLK